MRLARQPICYLLCPNCKGRGKWRCAGASGDRWRKAGPWNCEDRDKHRGVTWKNTSTFTTGAFKKKTSDGFIIWKLGHGTHEHKCDWCHGWGKVDKGTHGRWHTEKVVKALHGE